MRRFGVLFLIVFFSFYKLSYSSGWFNDDKSIGKKGFFWYEVNKKKEKKRVKEKEKETVIITKKDEDIKIPWDKVWTMHPKEFQALINKVQDLAVMNPENKERVKELYVLQAVASLRAKRFQEAVEEVRKEMPILDMSVRRSPSLVASLTQAEEEQKLREQIIPFMRENMGIIFFKSENCPYCKKQVSILEGFIKKWNWTHVEIVDINRQKDVALKFNVQVVPDLWVVGKVGDSIKQGRLKAGLSTLADIENGLLKAYYLWFENKNYDQPTMVDELVDIKEVIKSLSKEQRNESKTQ